MEFTRCRKAVAGLLIAAGLSVAAGCGTVEEVLPELFTPAARGGDDTVVAFASCLRVSRSAPIIADLRAVEPDLLVMLGDNIYADLPRRPERRADFRRSYEKLARQPYWKPLTESVPIAATWDDHDYGKNDAGRRWKLKAEAKTEFLRFWGFPADHPARERDGVYHAQTLGEPGRRVQVILLDTRWFRDDLRRRLKMPGTRGGPYRATSDTRRTILGEAQWAWLEEKLREPAEVRLIGSSIQVLADGHGYETWGNFPHERDRLLRLIETTGAGGVVLLSGDRHHAEMTRWDAGSGGVEAEEPGGAVAAYPLWDLTSSGLNEPSQILREENPRRVGEARRAANFGVVRIDWSGTTPELRFELVARGGEVFNAQAVGLDTLRTEPGE
ncbi:MAG: alkaline phosphatase D family protein [Planctomycetota bacterium]